MTTATPFSLNRAAKVILRVTSGFDATSARRITTNVPFPSDPHARHQAAITLTHLARALDPQQREEHLSWLTAKLLAYLAKQQVYEKDVPPYHVAIAIAGALNAQPHLLGSRAGISTILKRHADSQPNILTERANKPVLPRRTLWQDGPFTLAEATHPRHVREDGLTLHHCSANQYDYALLDSLSRRATPREALFALSYWRCIELGVIRFLTLLEDGAPRVTIEYHRRTWNISQIRAREPLTCRDPLLHPLSHALHCFRSTTPVIQIHGLPSPPDPHHILTIDGIYAPITEANLGRALAGHIRPTPHYAPSYVQLLTQAPNITIDLNLTYARQRNAITSVRGSLTDRIRTLDLPYLRHVGGHFHAGSARTVNCPSLETVGGSNICRTANTIRQPNLRSIAGSNICPVARHLEQPQLSRIGIPAIDTPEPDDLP